MGLNQSLHMPERVVRTQALHVLSRIVPSYKSASLYGKPKPELKEVRMTV